MLQKGSMTLPRGEIFATALDVYGVLMHILLIKSLFEDKLYFLEFGQHSIKIHFAN